MRGLHALVLAAGAGARFGGPKLLAPYGEGVLLDAALAAALGAPVETVSVVLGAEAAAVGAAARSFAARSGNAARLRLVTAADHAEGLAASLRAGVAALPADARAALVFLGDMPAVPPAVLEPLVQALESGADAAVPVFEGRRGHPAGFAAALLPVLGALTGDAGARRLLEALGSRVVEVAAPDAGVLLDVDTPADLERARGSKV